MTRDRDFKQVVRARMTETGESYTAARAALEQRPAPAPTGAGGTADQAVLDEAVLDQAVLDQAVLDQAVLGQAANDAARAEQERLVARLFTDGRLERVPGKRTTRAGALLEVLTRFEPGRTYTEREVNDVLLGVHEDFAYLRRELVNYHYLRRAEGRYWVVEQAPERSAIERQEIPAWEAVWLPGFVLGS